MKLTVDLKSFFLLPNLISSFRLILGFIIGLLFWSNPNLESLRPILVFSILIAYFSDILDGFLARKLKIVTELGKIIDPVADKFFIFVLVLILFLSGELEQWLFISIIGRDFLIIFGSYFFTSKRSFVIPSNYLGKFTVFFIGIYLLLLFLKIDTSDFVSNLFQFCIFGLLVFSLVKYFFDALLILKRG